MHSSIISKCASDILPQASIASGITLGRYRFHLRFPEGLRLSEFPGFVYHGALGAALKQVSPTAFAQLYGDQDIVRPWLLADVANCCAPGQISTVEIRLINGASRYLPEIFGAFMLAGAGGLGADRSPFVLEGIDEMLPGQEAPQALAFRDCASVQEHSLQAWCSDIHGQERDGVSVRFLTPVLLKEGNDIVRHQPSFRLIVSRIFSRISLLANDKAIDTESKAALLACADRVEVEKASIQWVSHMRYSGRQKQSMPFGGLVGELRFSAPSAQFSQWLQAAALVGIGGKTSFGFGQIAWGRGEADTDQRGE